MPSAADSSCESLLVSSGLVIEASTWPFLTTSPACTFSTTAPGEVAYRVGLTAATTLPSAAISRTKGPRSTVAKASRVPLTEESAENIRITFGAARAHRATARMPAPIRISLRLGWPFTSTSRSVAEVSRIMHVVPDRALRGPWEHESKPRANRDGS